MADKQEDIRKRGLSARYNRILLNLLEAVRGGLSRIELVERFLDALEGNHSADYLFLVEGYREISSDSLAGVRLRRVIGKVHGDQEKRLQEGIARRGPESPLLRDILINHQKLDFYNTAFASEKFGYGGEFLEVHGKKPVWLCAVPLPSTRASVPERALFAMWLQEGDDWRMPLPPGGEEEWALMQVLPSVYALLEHELSSLTEMVEEKRRKLIMELAPRAINHEFGTSVGLMKDYMSRIVGHLPKLKGYGSDPELTKIMEELLALRKQLDRSAIIAEAFTNIEKRKPDDIVPLEELITEAKAILSPLLRRNNIEIILEVPHRGIRLHTNAALVQHVILNVVHNAIEAIEDDLKAVRHAGTPEAFPLHHVWIRASLHEDDNERVEILISNDGPPLPAELGLSIFEKGVTSRPHGHGHGQGLYICRLVASYLDGAFGLCRPERPRPPGNVCFRLEFPRRLQRHEDMGGAGQGAGGE